MNKQIFVNVTKTRAQRVTVSSIEFYSPNPNGCTLYIKKEKLEIINRLATKTLIGHEPNTNNKIYALSLHELIDDVEPLTKSRKMKHLIKEL